MENGSGTTGGLWKSHSNIVALSAAEQSDRPQQDRVTSCRTSKLSSSLTRAWRHSFFGAFRVGCLLQHLVRLSLDYIELLFRFLISLFLIRCWSNVDRTALI